MAKIETYMTSVRDIVRRIPPVHVESTGSAIIQRFHADPATLVLAVVDRLNRPIGMIVRDPFLLAMAAPYGQALYANKSIGRLMNVSPLVVEADAPLHEVGDAALLNHEAGRLDGFLVVENGSYVGVGTPFDLLTAISRQLNVQASLDPLTRLANRAGFQQAIDGAFSDDAACGVALLLVDIDNFKTVNDTLGHPAGDALLVGIAGRLRAAAGECGQVSRLGGDEFAVLLSPGVDRAVAIAVGERIAAAVAEPLDVLGRRVRVTASLGISVAPEDAADGEALVRSADLALYDAKETGRGLLRVFTPGMLEEQVVRRSIESDLHNALAACELELHYQPIFSFRTRSIVGFEALLRWKHPRHGLVPPGTFIPLAEQSGQIVAIGAFVLERACREAARWPNAMKVAVNVSPIQLRSSGFLATVEGALACSGLPAHRLEIEITESVFVEEHADCLRALRDLRRLGVSLSLDDFGIGYSSLSYLRRFPVDRIKIDQSFVRDLSTDPVAQAIVRAVTSLGDRLGIAVTAEGVETEEQLGLLAQEGCSEIQGYFIGRPLPPGEIGALMEAPQEQRRTLVPAA